MEKEILDCIANNFKPAFRESAIKELLSIELKHVMAESAYNLYNTRMSILYLAQGNIKDLIDLTEKAKIDFRDVIMWASEERSKAKTSQKNKPIHKKT